MSNWVDTSEAVLQSLGISAKGQNITGVTLTIEPGEFPTATIKRVLLDAPAPRYVFEKVTFTDATPIEHAPFDLEAACTRARARLHNAIVHAGREARHHIARGFLDARINCGIAFRESDKRHMTNAEADMFLEFSLINDTEKKLILKAPHSNYRFSQKGPAV